MKKQSLRFLALLLVLLLALAPLGASAEAASSPANWTDIRQLVAGYDFVLGLRADCSLLYWGSRENGAAAAANFDEAGLREASARCRARGAKLYLTLNAIVFDGELRAVGRTLDAAAASGEADDDEEEI